MKIRWIALSIIVISTLLASACSALPSLRLINSLAVQSTTAATQPALQSPTQSAALPPAFPLPTVPAGSSAGVIAAMEGTLEAVYTQVNPSVVNIQVVSQTSVAQGQGFPFGFPFGNQNSTPQVQQALGSGFVWDKNGYIVTNNHVVNGATKVTVTFSDGSVNTAKVIGNDPDADLAVIKVEHSGPLSPVQLTDSDQVKVGELAIAIGNPFGLQGTMTVGYVSALGRSISADVAQSTSGGPTYTIPDVIQTDASINPGNSGGVLVNDQGYVMGVTAAIEVDSTRSNAGIGFVIPSNIVNRVVPELIKNGKFEHPYLGISGTDLSPQLATAMNLSESQRGALVMEITSGGPADKAGIKGSDRQAQINGGSAHVGGDVIVSVNGQKINRFDDLISFLFKNGVVGQSVHVGILRDGKPQTVDVVLAARPAAVAMPAVQQQLPRATNDRVTLGVQAINLDSTLAQTMNLDQNQKGVLVEQVIKGSPADQAGLKAGDKTFDYQGQQVLVGGDVITAVKGSPISTVQELRSAIAGAKPGDKIQLTILRNGKEMSVDVTLSDTSSTN